MKARGVSTTSAVFTVALVLQRGLPFFALPIVARAVSQESFGAIALVTTVAAVGALLMSLGIQGAVPRLIYDEGLAVRQAVWGALLRLQILTAVASAALICGALAVLELTGTSQLTSDWYLGPYIAACLSIQYLFQGVAVARGAAGRMLVASFAQVAIGAVLGPWLAFRFDVAGYLIALGLASLVAALILARPRPPRPLWEASGVRDGLGLALPFVGQGLATWFLALSDRLILAAYFSLEVVGVYQVSYMIGSALGLVLEGVQQAWAPRYYRSDRPDKRPVLLSLIPSFVPASVVAALLLAVVAPPILNVVVPGYRIDLAVLAIVALAGVPRAMYFVLVADLLERRMTKSIALSTLVGAVLAVGLDLLLLPLTGPWLAAVATVLAFAAQGLVVARTALGRAWRAEYLRWTALPLVAASGAMVVGVTVQRAGLAVHGIAAVLAVVALVIVVRRLFDKLRDASTFWATTAEESG